MKKLQKKLQLLSLLLIAGLLFSCMTIPAKAYIQKQGTVNEAVTLRQNADDKSGQVMELTDGQAVTVNNELTGSDGSKWYQVFVNGTTLGYVPVSTVTISGNASTGSGTSSTPSNTPSTGQTMQTITVTEKIGTVTASGAVRVRGGASTSTEQIASMDPKDTFQVIGEKTGDDQYVWYEIIFDDNGKEVRGYVRSDLVSVEEVTREEQVPVENPADTPSVPDAPKAPYTITSQVNAEGSTVWYLVDDATGDAKEISTLLKPIKEKGGNGVFVAIIVVLVVLVLAGGGAAAFFYIRWQDAEDFIMELRDKQMRAKKQPSPTPRVTPDKKVDSVKPAAKPVLPQSKPIGQPGMKEIPKPAAQPTQKEAPKPAAQPLQKEAPKPVTQPLQKEAPKPVTQPLQKEAPKPAAQPLQKEISKPVTQPVQKDGSKPTAKPVAKDELPKTKDIVNAAKTELQNQKAVKLDNVKPEKAWKSKNFLTDDDDLEFDFLDMEDK